MSSNGRRHGSTDVRPSIKRVWLRRRAVRWCNRVSAEELQEEEKSSEILEKKSRQGEEETYKCEESK